MYCSLFFGDAFPFLALALLAFCAAAKASGSEASKEMPDGGAECMTDSDCHGHGVCSDINITTSVSVGVCICEEHYTNSSCNYERKNERTAFLLHFFLGGFGAGRFYLGLILGAVFQLILTIVVWIFGVISKAADDESPLKKIFKVLSALGSLGIFVWWLVDCIFIGTNKYLDGKDARPYENM